MRILFLVFAVFLASPAAAEAISVNCASSTQYLADAFLCGNNGSVALQSPGPEQEFLVHATAPATHCSEIVYVFYKVGTPSPVGFSHRLAPGASEDVSIGKGYPAGDQKLYVGAIGFVSDCGSDGISGWGADITPAPAP